MSLPPGAPRLGTSQPFFPPWILSRCREKISVGWQGKVSAIDCSVTAGSSSIDEECRNPIVLHVILFQVSPPQTKQYHEIPPRRRFVVNPQWVPRKFASHTFRRSIYFFLACSYRNPSLPNRSSNDRANSSVSSKKIKTRNITYPVLAIVTVNQGISCVKRGGGCLKGNGGIVGKEKRRPLRKLITSNSSTQRFVLRGGGGILPLWGEKPYNGESAWNWHQRYFGGEIRVTWR